MASNSASFTRRDLPSELRNLTTWPQVDTSQLSPDVRDIVGRRQRAIRAYLEGHPLEHIRRDCAMTATQIGRCLKRCLAVHPDGRIYGWRALLPYQHTRAYVRLATPATDSRGNAGTFLQFLRDHPEISAPLDETILTTKVTDAVRESRYSHAETYGHFCRLCRRAGISRTRYPFNTRDQGKRALRRYARELLNAHFAAAAGRTGGADARVRSRVGIGKSPGMKAETPFDLVSIDAHRLNFIGCIGIPTPGRVELLPIHRMQFMPLIDHYSTAVLGYHVAITREPSASEVIKATSNALTLWKPRTLSLRGQSYPEGAMMPSAALPEATGLCWNALLVDNASIHCSIDVAEGLRRRLGCALNFGPVRQWYRRPLVECLFSALERAGFLRLPNSTGIGPADPHRSDAAANAVKYEMLFEEMLDLIDVVVCTYNGTRRESLGHASPLERLCDAVLGASGFWFPRTLPPLPPWVPELGVTVLTKVIRGDRKQGRRPYIQYEHVRYTNPILSAAYDLIGREIRVHVNVDDLRTVKAFLPSGEEIGVLTASTGWDRIQHDRGLRQNILRAIHDKSLAVEPGEDAIQSYLVLKAQQALERRDAKKTRRHTVSPEGTALARAVHVSAQPVPPITSRAPPAPDCQVTRAVSNTSLPSFVPQVRHRGVVK
jgi:putative transposase